MKLKPDLQLSIATVQAILDQKVSAPAVVAISRLHGSEIAAVYEIAFADASQPPPVLKVYPDDLHWKMQKEVTVLGLIGHRLSVPLPRILRADDSRKWLDLTCQFQRKLKEFADRGGDARLAERVAGTLPNVNGCWTAARRRSCVTTICTPATCWLRSQMAACASPVLSTSRTRWPETR